MHRQRLQHTKAKGCATDSPARQAQSGSVEAVQPPEYMRTDIAYLVLFQLLAAEASRFLFGKLCLEILVEPLDILREDVIRLLVVNCLDFLQQDIAGAQRLVLGTLRQ